MTARPDPLIHPITRLSICGLLAAGADWVEFAALRDAAGISDSVLSKQSRVLEDAGYVEVRKGAIGRRPRTWFRLTAEGRQALEGHLAWLAQLEKAVSASARDMQKASTEQALTLGIAVRLLECHPVDLLSPCVFGFPPGGTQLPVIVANPRRRSSSCG